MDGRGVKPRVLVADQSITQLENVKDPDLDRCPTTLHTRPFLLYVACQERLVDNKTAVLSGESPDRLQNDIRYGVEDRGVNLAHFLFSVEWGFRMGDVVPHDVIRIGGQCSLDVMSVLGGEVPIDDVRFYLLRRNSGFGTSVQRGLRPREWHDLASAHMKADLIVRDGVVFTGTDDPKPGGVAVRNGRIVGVGDVKGFDSPRTETIDADGGLITPGFIDAHVHPLSGGLKLAHCSLYDATTAQEALELVGAYAKARQGAEWIWGGGWSMEWFPRGTPSAEALDQVTGDRPALLYNKDGHGAWVNTAALRRAHISATTGDPNDGRIERLDDGRPQGTLHEGAMDLVSELLPKFTRTDWEAALLAGQKYLFSCGITGWQDADVQPAQEEAYIALAGRGELKASVVGALWWKRDQALEQIDALLGRRARFAPGYRPTSVKLMLDGIVENYTAALLEPYRDYEGNETENTGIDFIDGTLLKEIVRILDRLGFQCHFHTLGSRAVRHALDALDALPAPRRRSHHLAHLQVVDRADVHRFAEVGAIANCQALWACREPQMTDLTLPFLGPTSADNQYPFAGLARAGATLAMGSDWPVSTANVYEQIDVAVTRTHREYRERPPLDLVQSLTLTQALNGFTNGSAQVNRVEHEVGRIKVGMEADLAIADRNPFVGGSIADTKITHTIIGGTVVFSTS